MSATATRRNYSPVDEVAIRVREEVVSSLMTEFVDRAIIHHAKRGYRHCDCPHCVQRKYLIVQAMNVRYRHPHNQTDVWVYRDAAIRRNREFIRHAINEECVRPPHLSR